MQAQFTRWCLNAPDRTPVSVDPTHVASTEEFSPAFKHNGTNEDFPAATRIILKNKKEYIVQGSVAEVVAALNSTESANKKS